MRWLEKGIYLEKKRSGNERSGGSLSQNEFDGNVKEAEDFHESIAKS